MEAEKPKERVKYDALSRDRITKRISELTSQNLTGHEIFQAMRNEGFKSPDGSPITRSVVDNYIWRFRQRTQAPKTTPETVKNLPNAALGILTDPDLTDSQKVRMLIAYAAV